MSDFTVEHDGEYIVHCHGSGEPIIGLLGGITYSPLDMVDLCENLPGTKYVVNNPIHKRREMRGKADWPNDQVQLRNGFARVLEKRSVELIIGHSLGAHDAANIHHQISSVLGLVLITPPLAPVKPAQYTSREIEYEGFDWLMALNSTDISDSRYQQMLRDQDEEYDAKRLWKRIFRREVPGFEDFKRMFNIMIESRVPILTILGEQDVWHPGENFQPDSFPKVTSVTIESNHNPHISQPAIVAQLIQSWMHNIYKI